MDNGGYGVSWNDDIDISEYELWNMGKIIKGLLPLSNKPF